MSASDVYENHILDSILGGDHSTRFPATVHIALFSTATGDDGSGTELSGGAYARVAVANDDTQWPDAAGGQKSNGAAIEFPEATANWTQATHFAVMDAPTAGNMIVHGQLTTPVTCVAGTKVRFQAGSLVVTAD